jgi:2-iminobutanoate/2-iminopropanoate deaminase
MTSPESFDAGIAHQIGHYADAVRIPVGYEQILVSGTPGLAPDGTLASDITGQATQAWQNIEAILAKAGASLSDIVAVRQWLTSAEDISGYVAVRGQFIKHEPAFMLGVIPALVRPEFLVEIEIGLGSAGAARAACCRRGAPRAACCCALLIVPVASPRACSPWPGCSAGSGPSDRSPPGAVISALRSAASG